MKQLIPNTAINRLAVRIWRKHLVRWTLDTPTGAYADRKVSRLICSAIRDAKGDPSFVGDDFERLFFKAQYIAKACAATRLGSYGGMTTEDIITSVIESLNCNILGWFRRRLSNERDFSVE